MHPFSLERPRDLAAALSSGAQAGRNDAAAEFIAGGTDMVQLLQFATSAKPVVRISRGSDNVARDGGRAAVGGSSGKRHSYRGWYRNPASDPTR